MYTLYYRPHSSNTSEQTIPDTQSTTAYVTNIQPLETMPKNQLVLHLGLVPLALLLVRDLLVVTVTTLRVSPLLARLRTAPDTAS